MSRRLLVSVLAVSFIAIASTGILCAYTELDTAAAIRAEGQIPFTPGPLLDDFNAGVVINAWNCTTDTFAKTGTTATCTASYTDIAYGGTGRSLDLNYNVNETDSYAGYVSQLSSPLGNGNLTSPTEYTALSFYVRGAAVSGGEFFKIQLNNTSGDNIYFAPESFAGKGDATHYSRNVASVYITDYLDGGVISTEWKKVTIPLHNFANLDGFSSMKEFAIIFENSQSTTNGSATSGTIYIDNITFEISDVNAVRIDHFGHKGKNELGIDVPGANALGGNIGWSGGDGGTVNAFADGINYPIYKYSMRLEYNVTAGYAFTYLIFGGGNTIKETSPKHPVASEYPDRAGWIAIPHDFSAYTNITFKARAETDAKNPKTMKLELAYGVGDNNTYVLIDAIPFGGFLTTSWKTYTIPLSAFPLLGTNPIKKLTFTFEGWRIGDAGGSKTGTVFIDSVQFE
ncbi:MAG: hypothetical protein Q8R48_07210 [Candidatus Omnitrophota bacterium]|nr:hypothetical protein [Candidatus Omnitrophota bacterium]